MPALGSKKIGNYTYMFRDWFLKLEPALKLAKELRKKKRVVKIIRQKPTKNSPGRFLVYVKKIQSKRSDITETYMNSDPDYPRRW